MEEWVADKTGMSSRNTSESVADIARISTLREDST
jgi:hypothetical protein